MVKQVYQIQLCNLIELPTLTTIALPLVGGRISKNLAILNCLHYFKWGFLKVT